jgi:hypothetical protein
MEDDIMSKLKAFMDHPYTRGDYYGALAVVAGLYAILGAVYVVWKKADEWKTRHMIKEVTDKDEEA